jgi:hypothetical protein
MPPQYRVCLRASFSLVQVWSPASLGVACAVSMKVAPKDSALCIAMRSSQILNKRHIHLLSAVQKVGGVMPSLCCGEGCANV